MTLKRRIADLEFEIKWIAPIAQNEKGPPYTLDDLVKLFQYSIDKNAGDLAISVEYNRIVESYEGMELVTLEEWAQMHGLTL